MPVHVVRGSVFQVCLFIQHTGTSILLYRFRLNLSRRFEMVACYQEKQT